MKVYDSVSGTLRFVYKFENIVQVGISEDPGVLMVLLNGTKPSFIVVDLRSSTQIHEINNF